jgi:ribosomal protein S18 acetylase RimI-like enzyme
MTEEYLLRPLNLRKDFEQLVSLLELVFANEISARGMNIREELERYKRLMPLLKIVGVFSKMFKHPFEGFVFENNKGELIASVNASYSYNRWIISMVATHPDYRRKGLARDLVKRVINLIKKHDGHICILEVISENVPAYNLYTNLGFIHYDSIAEMKLEPENWPKEFITLPDKYRITELKRDKKTSEQRYQLKVRETPNDVQQFLPVDKRRYEQSKIKKVLRPIAKKLFSLSINQWTIYHKEELVGSILVEIDHTGKNTHRIELVIDPKYSSELIKPMLHHSLLTIQKGKYLDRNVLMTIRSTDETLLKTITDSGFVIIENNHILGLKL